MNINNADVVDSQHFNSRQANEFNSVPMTYLTNQIGTINGTQAVYAQVDRQRKRNDLSQQQQQHQQHVDC